MTLSKPVATAILAVYNGEATINACLDSLLKQTENIEIIVVDDGSTDKTKELVEKYKQVKLLTQSHSGPAKARNFAASKSQANILLFVDADMTFDSGYTTMLTAPIRSGQVIGTYTTEERVSNWDNVWARCWNYQEDWEDGKRFPANPPQWGTDFRAIKKSEFMRVRGFDHIGYTDTWSLFHKLKVKPLATKAMCYHANPKTLRQVYYQAQWAAKRPYKYGLLGTTLALVRTSLPCSLIRGVYVALRKQEPRFLAFKLYYDLGRFMGILKMMLTGNLVK